MCVIATDSLGLNSPVGYHRHVLAADLQLVDLDSRHWANWYQLLVPPRLLASPRIGLLILRAGQPIKAVLRDRGAVPVEQIPFTGTDRDALATCARALDLDLLLVAEQKVLGEIVRRVERKLDIGDDYVKQLLTIVRALSRYRGAGIWSEPPILELIPPLSYDPLQRTFDALVANKTSMLVYVFDDEKPEAGDERQVHTSIIAVKRRGHLDLVTTHLGLCDEMSERKLAKNWRKRYRKLLKLVDERYARPSLGVFMTRAAWQRIVLGPPEQLGREINRRDVILDPAPAWLLGLLGGATMAAVAGRGAKALARMLPPQARLLATNLASSAQSAMRGSGAHPFALLGFDPIELWHQLRRMYQPVDAPPVDASIDSLR